MPIYSYIEDRRNSERVYLVLCDGIPIGAYLYSLQVTTTIIEYLNRKEATTLDEREDIRASLLKESASS